MPVAGRGEPLGTPGGRPPGTGGSCRSSSQASPGRCAGPGPEAAAGIQGEHRLHPGGGKPGGDGLGTGPAGAQQRVAGAVLPPADGKVQAPGPGPPGVAGHIVGQPGEPQRPDTLAARVSDRSGTGRTAQTARPASSRPAPATGAPRPAGPRPPAAAARSARPGRRRRRWSGGRRPGRGPGRPEGTRSRPQSRPLTAASAQSPPGQGPAAPPGTSLPCRAVPAFSQSSGASGAARARASPPGRPVSNRSSGIPPAPIHTRGRGPVNAARPCRRGRVWYTGRGGRSPERKNCGKGGVPMAAGTSAVFLRNVRRLAGAAAGGVLRKLDPQRPGRHWRWR